MKVKILRSTVAAGSDVFEGDTLVLDDEVAKELIRLGKAVEVTGKPSKAAAKAEEE